MRGYIQVVVAFFVQGVVVFFVLMFAFFFFFLVVMTKTPCLAKADFLPDDTGVFFVAISVRMHDAVHKIIEGCLSAGRSIFSSKIPYPRTDKDLK